MTDRVDLLERLVDDERLDDLTLGQLRAVVEHIDWPGSQPSTLAFEDDGEHWQHSPDARARTKAIQMLRSALKFVLKAGGDDPDPRYIERWPMVVQRALELTDSFDEREPADQEEFADGPDPGPTAAQPGLPDLSGPFRSR